MEDKKTNKNPKIELESLLRLKRYEQPDEHFWGSFEKQLHQKMLSSLIARASLRTRFKRRISIILHSAYALPTAAAVLIACYALPVLHKTASHSLNKINLASIQNSNTEIPFTETHFAIEDIQVEMNSNASYLVEMPTNAIIADDKEVEYYSSAYMPYQNASLNQISTLY